jgi:hypothetical protein
VSDVDVSRLAERLRELGIADAEELAAGVAAGGEGRAWLARALIVLQIWSNVIDFRRDGVETWVENTLADEHDPTAAFGDSARALRRILDAGAAPSDVGLLARGIAYDTAFSVLYGLDGGLNEPNVDDLWDLLDMEIEELLVALNGLHESLLTGDPSGRDGQPAPGE